MSPEALKDGKYVALEAKDNWANRVFGMVCGTCMFFVLKPNDEKDVGRCRRHAPTLGGWPVVFPSDWCGDHKLK